MRELFASLAALASSVTSPVREAVAQIRGDPPLVAECYWCDEKISGRAESYVRFRTYFHYSHVHDKEPDDLDDETRDLVHECASPQRLGVSD